MGVLRLLRMKCALKEPNRAFSQLGRLRSPRPLQCSAMMVGAFWSLCVACHQVSALAQFCFHRFACSSCEAGHEKATPESHITQSVMSLQSCLETMAFGLKTPQKYNRSPICRFYWCSLSSQESVQALYSSGWRYKGCSALVATLLSPNRSRKSWQRLVHCGECSRAWDHDGKCSTCARRPSQLKSSACSP